VASSVIPQVPKYDYVVIRLKMAESVKSLVGTALLCHYGETNDVFSIGGLVQPEETSPSATIRHGRHIVIFCNEHNDRLYIAKELNAFMDHELVKIIILITIVLCDKLKWRARHHTPALNVAVIERINEVVVAL